MLWHVWPCVFMLINRELTCMGMILAAFWQTHPTSSDVSERNVSLSDCSVTNCRFLAVAKGSNDASRGQHLRKQDCTPKEVRSANTGIGRAKILTFSPSTSLEKQNGNLFWANLKESTLERQVSGIVPGGKCCRWFIDVLLCFCVTDVMEEFGLGDFDDLEGNMRHIFSMFTLLSCPRAAPVVCQWMKTMTAKCPCCYHRCVGLGHSEQYK